MEGSAENEEYINLELTLRMPSPPPSSALPVATPSQLRLKTVERTNADVRCRTRRYRTLRINKPVIIEPPFPWSTDHRVKVHSLTYLLSHKIDSIHGYAQCKHCNTMQSIAFDLNSKFSEVVSFIQQNKAAMHNRSPEAWKKPTLPRCPQCGTNECLSPVVNGVKKRNLNWLFMFLGQMLGCLKLKHLMYFCKHNELHRTGAKDRLLYSTYLCLCKQLNPSLSLDVD